MSRAEHSNYFAQLGKTYRASVETGNATEVLNEAKRTTGYNLALFEKQKTCSEFIFKCRIYS